MVRLNSIALMCALTITAAGCGQPITSQGAICDGSEGLRTDHAAALVEDGGPLSKQTGAALIIAIDAGCEQ